MTKWALSLLTSVAIIFSFSLPVFAVTAWWSEPGMIVEADEAIIPAILQDQALNNSEPSNTLATARTLKVGAAPLDGVIVAGKENWYVLLTEDGPGFIRIGATGPLMIEEATELPGKDFAPGDWSMKLDGPQNGAILLETSLTSITELAHVRKAKRSLMRIGTGSTTPVAYRISFVSELPENRVGCAYGPGVAADQYIMALANEGPLYDLYRTTRIRYTIEQAIVLREKLFGITDPRPRFWGLHVKDPSVDPNVAGKLPVQHIILSDDQSRHWAFVITCQQRDGLWVVSDARRDPEMTEEELTGIIRRDEEKMELRLGGSPKQLRPRPLVEPLPAPEPKAR